MLSRQSLHRPLRALFATALISTSLTAASHATNAVKSAHTAPKTKHGKAAPGVIPAVTLTESQSGKTIMLRPGAIVIVNLADNAGSSGYVWNVLLNENDALIKPIGFGYTPAPAHKSGPPIVGAPGVDSYRFVVTADRLNPGETLAEQLRFLSIPPFQKDVTKGRWVTYSLVVTGLK